MASRIFLRRSPSSLRSFLPLTTPYSPPTARPFSSLSTPPKDTTTKLQNERVFPWRSYKRNEHLLWAITCVPAVIMLGSDSALLEEMGPAEVKVQAGDSREAHVLGLQKVEDGSIISNIHTSKWRIFTDKARELFLQGKLDEAEKCFLSALQEAKLGFGDGDPHVASSCQNLAELYRVRKRFDKAEPLYIQAIDILEKTLGPEDVRVAFALHNLGGLYLLQHKLEEAKLHYERALKIKGRVLGLSHVDYADSMFHLGKVLQLLGNLKDSAALLSDSVQILEQAGGGESTTCIIRMRHLVQVLLHLNQFKEAESVQRKILHFLLLSKGWDSLETVAAAENLALTLQSMGNLVESQELLERCVDVRKGLLGTSHNQVSDPRLSAKLKTEYLKSLKHLLAILAVQPNDHQSLEKMRMVKEEVRKLENDLQYTTKIT